MAETKNLCAQISLDLHQKISEAREAAEQQEEAAPISNGDEADDSTGQES